MRRQHRARLQRLALHVVDSAAATAVDSPIKPGSLKFEKIEENRSGDPDVAQGFGRVATTQPPKFTPDQREEIVEFFRKEGFAVIVGAYSPEEVDHLNGFFSRTQADEH